MYSRDVSDRCCVSNEASMQTASRQTNSLCKCVQLIEFNSHESASSAQALGDLPDVGKEWRARPRHTKQALSLPFRVVSRVSPWRFFASFDSCINFWKMGYMHNNIFAVKYSALSLGYVKMDRPDQAFVTW